MFYQHNFYIPSESQMPNLSPTPKIPSGVSRLIFNFHQLFVCVVFTYYSPLCANLLHTIYGAQ